VIVVLVEAAALWQVLGDQVALMFGGAGAVVHRQRSWFAVLTGETSAEMNIAGLAATATAGDAGRLVAAIDAVGDGAIVAVSEQLADHATAPLAAAGFSRVGTPDALMVRPAGPPAAISTCAYEIRRAGAEDVRRAEPVVVAAHGLEVGVIDRAFNLDALARGQLGAWAAWDGDVPVSVAWLTLEPPLPGVWEVMTHPAYRRRGAARAILTRAMADAADVALAGFFLWSTPAGRPLYSALGFSVLEEVAAWARGLSDEELALLEAASAPELA
jgi:GNAT superfamily N-acetyltransferase